MNFSPRDLTYNADYQYKRLVMDILDYGTYGENRTEDNTKKIFGVDLRFDLSKEFPLLTLKKTGIKTLTNEILWIMQQGSNDVSWLHDHNVHIWDEWATEDRDGRLTIGKAYGYQIEKHNQIRKLIHTLKTDPQSRRMIIDLWNWEDTPYMNLTPCALMSHYDVNDGYLNTHLIIRSSDVALGLPYNIAQYAVLNHMLAQATGYKAGILKVSITNAHLYEQHFEPISMIFKREPNNAPQIKLNPDIKDFYDFTADDVELVDYDPHMHIRMRVSV